MGSLFTLFSFFYQTSKNLPLEALGITTVSYTTGSQHLVPNLSSDYPIQTDSITTLCYYYFILDINKYGVGLFVVTIYLFVKRCDSINKIYRYQWNLFVMNGKYALLNFYVRSTNFQNLIRYIKKHFKTRMPFHFLIKIGQIILIHRKVAGYPQFFTYSNWIYVLFIHSPY